MKKSLIDYALKIQLPLVLFVALLSFAATYFISRPERDGVGYAPKQPIAFSHKLHAGEMGIDCQYCHTGVTESRFASIPSVSTCMNCHSVARKNRPEIVKLTKYNEEKQPIPWKVVHRIPEYAYFNHSAHVNKGIDCKNCHGDVEQMDVLTQVNAFAMSNCLNCHRNAPTILASVSGIQKGPENCNTCHR